MRMGIYEAGTEYTRMELHTGRRVQAAVILRHLGNLVTAVGKALNC